MMAESARLRSENSDAPTPQKLPRFAKYSIFTARRSPKLAQLMRRACCKCPRKVVEAYLGRVSLRPSNDREGGHVSQSERIWCPERRTLIRTEAGDPAPSGAGRRPARCGDRRDPPGQY